MKSVRGRNNMGRKIALELGGKSRWPRSFAPLWKISGAPLAMARGHLLLVNTANVLAKPQRQKG